MKNLLLAIIVSLSAVLAADAQINFKDRNLAILEKISFSTSFRTVKSFMAENNYTFIEEIESEISVSDEEYIEVVYLEFKGPAGNTVTVGYDKDDKTFLGVFNQIAAINSVFCEMELEEENFNIKEQSEEGKLWVKSSYKYQIGTDSSDEKVHSLVFISPDHPEFVN